MKEQIFFIINNMEIILDQVLVEYNEEPIFFVCRHDQHYFIALNADLEEERYFVAEVSLSHLSKMLHERITMRALILQADKFWDITAGEDYTSDCIIEKPINEIQIDLLPYENAYLKITTKDVEEYVEKIDSVLYGEGIWEEEFVQTSAEYMEGLIKNINEQLEILMQKCYESVITISRKDFADYSFESENIKEIYSCAIQIKTVESKMDMAYPFAA